jgi:hypothetical protein
MDSRIRRYGLVGAVASAFGALGAVAIIAWDRQVPADRFSYPFDAGWFTFWQVVFAVQHVAMLPLFGGLLLLERGRPSRALRVGTWIGLAGMALLAVNELVAIAARDALVDDSTGSFVGTLYTLPMVLLGIGPLVAGIGVVRTRLLDGSARWLLLGLGGYVFAVMFPAVFGPMVAGRLAIGAWMLGYAWLGLALRQSPVSPASSLSPSMTTTA